MSDTFRIRRATGQNADIVAWQRARMFQEMGEVSGEAVETLRRKARARIEEWIECGDYAGWLASPTDKPDVLVGGAGIQLQRILPRPLGPSTISEGRQGTIVNVFTEPEWRRHGIGSLLMKEIIAWSRNEGLDRLLLHASEKGRPVYEQLGFVASNEMRFAVKP